MKKYWTLALTLCLALGSLDSHAARRLGGGGSMGKQSSNVTQRESSTQASPAAPAQGMAAPATANRPAQAATPAQPSPTQAAPQRRPWGAMLGGLAAGLGLAWLAHSLGLGAEFGQFLMFALVALVLMVVAGAILRSRRASSGAYAYSGVPGGVSAPAPARQYNPDKVGNDASARPWEQQGAAFDATPASAAPGGGLRIGSALAGSQTWGIPADFDAAGFISAAKGNFVTLQDAWDRGDVAVLRSMMTDEMVGEIRTQLEQREAHRGSEPNHTEVVMLEAQLLGIEDLGQGYMASVEFSGLIREEPSAGPSPFREVWNMTKPKDGHVGWLVAGVQALQ